MAKVTVYVPDDQLDRLKAVKGFGRGGISRMFQAFIDASIGGGGDPAARYDYARKLMPTHDAIDRHRRRLARKVQTGGPPADGGPVSAALTILLYKRLLDEHPDLGATLEKEFARFGLDELVASETEGLDLLAEPDEDDDPEDEELDLGGVANLGALGFRVGDDVREALRVVQSALREARDPRTGHGLFGPPPPPPPRGPRGPRGRRRLVVEVSSGDDPRDVLSVNDFTTFTRRHPDWEEGAALTPSQMETVRELLIRRAGGDPDVDDAGDGGEGDER